MVAHNCHGKTKNLTTKTKTSRQNQKPRGKNKIPHGKTKNLTAKTKYFTAKPKTSRQNQILHSKTKIALLCFCREVFGFCCEVFGFAVRFGFVVRYFVFALRFLVLPWGILFLPWGFWFCRDSCRPPYETENILRNYKDQSLAHHHGESSTTELQMQIWRTYLRSSCAEKRLLRPQKFCFDPAS